MLCVGAGFAALTALLGWFLMETGGYGADSARLHKWFGLTTAALVVLVVLLHRWAGRGGRDRAWLTYSIAFAVCCVTLGAAGHFGAGITHGEDYLTAALPWNQRESKAQEVLAEIRAVKGEEASSEQLDRLNLEVRALFAHRCFRCHGNEKREGDLILETEDGVRPFVDIGQRFTVGEAEELKAFHTAGFPGYEWGPFFIPDPSSGLESVKPPAGMTAARFERRHALYREFVEKSPLGRRGSGHHKESLVRSMEQAYRLLRSPEARAFNLSDEPKENHDAYDTGRFGLGCLLARRLVEHGERFVSVTTEYELFLGWDTHENGHMRLVGMKKLIDRPVAQLIRDLDERGHLDRTLVILASEFSRDMIQEGRPEAKVRDQVEVPDRVESLQHYGMHRHFTDGCSILLFGGGVKRGFVYGETADERPCVTVGEPVHIDRIHQTIYHALGIPPETHSVVEGRPVYTTPEGEGEPIMDVLA